MIARDAVTLATETPARPRIGRRARPRLYVLGSTNETNADLAEELSAFDVPTTVIGAGEALEVLRPGDTALARLDVLPTLDGVEAGLLATLLLQRRGVRVLNPAASLLAAHDKVRTARLLEAACIPHPRTVSRRAGDPIDMEPPLVLKPRFGSWGRDVYLCLDESDVQRTLAKVSGRTWYRRHGVLVQEYVPAPSHDLRMLVAGGRLVGAATRVAAPGEWRTNVSLGGSLEGLAPPPTATALATAAVEAMGADLMGVDLIPTEGGGHLVLEVNAAAEFDRRYTLDGRDVFHEIAWALGLFGHRARCVPESC